MDVVRTYLALDRAAAVSAPAVSAPADAALDVRRVARPTAGGYRALYAAVGADHRWRDRDAWTDERLQAHLDDPAVSLWVLHDGGAPAGYFELQRRGEGGDVEVELLYFGLVPAVLRRGLGRRLLERAIAEAWAEGAARLVLNTCSLDHAAALPNYLARGFRIEREETYDLEPIA